MTMKYILILFISLLPFFTPKTTYAQEEWSSQNAKCVAGPDNDVATIKGFECLFYNILQVISLIAGIVFFVMFLVGSFQYLFSLNDPKRVAQAGSTLTMAFVGLLGVIISWLILRFIQQFTGINVTNFVIPS